MYFVRVPWNNRVILWFLFGSKEISELLMWNPLLIVSELDELEVVLLIIVLLGFCAMVSGFSLNKMYVRPMWLSECRSSQ